MTTFPLNLLYSLWCGGLLAACAGPRTRELAAALGSTLGDRPGRRRGAPATAAATAAAPAVLAALAIWSRLLLLPALFAALSVLPAATYLAAQFPDWTLMYLIDPQRLLRPWQWALGIGAATGAAVVLGFALGVAWFWRAGGRPLMVALAALLLVYLGLVLLGFHAGRLSAVGSFASFHAGGWLMQPLFSLSSWRLGYRPFGLLYSLLAINLCLKLALVVVARTLLTKGEFIFAVAPSASPPAHGNYWQS